MRYWVELSITFDAIKEYLISKIRIIPIDFSTPTSVEITGGRYEKAKVSKYKHKHRQATNGPTATKIGCREAKAILSYESKRPR
jgi:hypothetical protein